MSWLWQPLPASQADSNEVVTTDKWFIPLSEPKRFKKPAPQFQHLAYTGAAPFPETIFYDKYAFEWSQPYPAKRRVRTGAELYQAFQPTPIISIPWFVPLTEPKRFKAALKEAAQLFFTFQPWPVIDISWFNPLTEPKRFRASLKAAQIQVFFFQPWPVIDIAWWAPLTEPKRFKRALAAGQQLFYAAPSQPAVEAMIPWFAPLTDPKRFKPKLLEANQMALTLHPNPVVSFSWIYGLSEPVRIKPRLIEAAKEKASHMIFVNVPSSTGPLFIRGRMGTRATFWKGRSDGQ